MNDKVRFAYVGCGFVAQTIHIPNFVTLADCDFRAIAEVRQDIGQKVARRYGIAKVYRSHEEIAADPEIEAVGVSGPYALQGNIAEDLIRAGKHVFMEKPMAVSVERAERLLEAVKSQRGAARLMVGYMKRYDPGNIMLKQHLDAWRTSGEAGRILLARNHGFGGNWLYAKDSNVPWEKSSEKAPAALDVCPPWLPENRKGSYLGYLQQWTHNLNLLRYFLARDDTPPAVTVKSVQLDDADGMTGLVVLDIGGTRAVVESGYTKFHAWEEHTQIYFESGWLRTAAPPLMHKETAATVELYRAAQGEQPCAIERGIWPQPAWSYREEARHFLQQIRTGKPFLSSGEDTLHDVRLCEEIYKQFLNV